MKEEFRPEMKRGKKKEFDCVEMKREAALRVYEETKDMSLEEREAYWQRKCDEFLRVQQERKCKISRTVT